MCQLCKVLDKRKLKVKMMLPQVKKKYCTHLDTLSFYKKTFHWKTGMVSLHILAASTSWFVLRFHFRMFLSMVSSSAKCQPCKELKGRALIAKRYSKVGSIIIFTFPVANYGLYLMFEIPHQDSWQVHRASSPQGFEGSHLRHASMECRLWCESVWSLHKSLDRRSSFPIGRERHPLEMKDQLAELVYRIILKSHTWTRHFVAFSILL